jgi:hypothetical protein
MNRKNNSIDAVQTLVIEFVRHRIRSTSSHNLYETKKKRRCEFDDGNNFGYIDRRVPDQGEQVSEVKR